MSMGQRAALANVMRLYGNARSTERFGRSSPAWAAFGTLASEIGRIPGLSRLTLKWSIGRGAWARIPWVALLHPDLAESVRKGVAIVLLLRADLTGAYLTLSQGVSRAGGDMELWRRAVELRHYCETLADRGFQLDGKIDLRDRGYLARGYQQGTIAHRLYDAERLPEDPEIERDFTGLASVYTALPRS
jgi:hypothetical protein